MAALQSDAFCPMRKTSMYDTHTSLMSPLQRADKQSSCPVTVLLALFDNSCRLLTSLCTGFALQRSHHRSYIRGSLAVSLVTCSHHCSFRCLG